MKKIVLILIFLKVLCCYAEQLPQIIVKEDKFINIKSGKDFYPYGVNYDHNYKFMLLENFWQNKDKISEDFTYIRKLNFNIIRIHLQQFVFLKSPNEIDTEALKNLDWIIQEAEKNHLYLDITGLGRYKGIIPDWYKKLNDNERIKADAFFWKSLAKRYKGKNCIFCFNFQNEPTINYDNNKGYVGPPFHDKFHYINKHFQEIRKAWKIYLINKYNSEDTFNHSWLKSSYQNYKNFKESEINIPQLTATVKEQKDFSIFKDTLALKWLKKLSETVKTIDPQRLVTLGLSALNLPGSKYYSSFSPQLIKPYVDFICFHAYPVILDQNPDKDNRKEFINQIILMKTNKPLVIEEFYPLVPLSTLYPEFIKPVQKYVSGWISFYWGNPIEKLKDSNKISDNITAEWLEYFSKNKNKIIEIEL